MVWGCGRVALSGDMSCVAPRYHKELQHNDDGTAAGEQGQGWCHMRTAACKGRLAQGERLHWLCATAQVRDGTSAVIVYALTFLWTSFVPCGTLASSALPRCMLS